ncbi:endonuclease domain-containing protein [Tardiphaga alba]|uniref:endonuclease domain-containing protein n=1 Tax=Tardiphaga alba TaxID=340268 RepID=UPI0020131BA4|nr:endonuclease domain-containing protein [Tardiphaga alba]
MRKDMTDAERRLWYLLRAHRFQGFKFKRQVPVGPFVIDFACMGLKVLIEVDGGQHAENEADLRRTKWLESRGFRVLRFWNNEVLKNTGAVLEEILSAVTVDSPSPGAPLRGRHPLPHAGEGKKEQ